MVPIDPIFNDLSVAIQTDSLVAARNIVPDTIDANATINANNSTNGYRIAKMIIRAKNTKNCICSSPLQKSFAS